MKEFWKEEVELFKRDLENAWDFLFQPVTFRKKEEAVLALKPNEEEIIEKAEAIANKDESVANMSDSAESFWNKEFELLRQDVSNAWDFLFQPVQIFKK